jgi:hypothetical protein
MHPSSQYKLISGIYQKMEDGEIDIARKSTNVQITILTRRMKKLTTHVAFLHNRLVGKYDEESDQLNAHFADYLASEQQAFQNPQQQQQKQNAEGGEGNATGEGGHSGVSASGGPVTGGGGAGSDMTDDELKELEILKYKYENGVDVIKKEYEAQLEFVTGKVEENIFVFDSGFFYEN